MAFGDIRLRVHIYSAVNEKPHSFDVSTFRCQVQRCLALHCLGADVGPMLNEEAYVVDGSLPVSRCRVKRGFALLCFGDEAMCNGVVRSSASAKVDPVKLSGDGQQQSATVPDSLTGSTFADAEDLTTPLHIASSWKNHDILRFLVERGANTNAETEERETPLHSASRHRQGAVDNVRFLVERGANIGAETMERETPLHLASECGNIETMRFFIDRGSRCEREGGSISKRHYT
ncbi:ankyrin repeat-containing domain protein [Lactarius akahatsu]|uniref:Ankyrin repeat-containing domain protein n=1 Tax=Lactarius akahatsu TaxID=416441 RepID=A0AAD4L3T6_9AGAM|nr:ankyrin repeat-containing domain protein [Lactarius akahatsu]